MELPAELVPLTKADIAKEAEAIEAAKQELYLRRVRYSKLATYLIAIGRGDWVYRQGKGTPK